ncbi:MAG: DUF1573 domain-containing protein, partial [Planctomycetes bacterium]|nr:DUF1573 domain-containing protein [Planctomycetota bacterium]
MPVALLAVAALCGGVVAGQSDGAAKNQRPKITLGAKEWRFGSVWQGASLSREFTLKNTGDAPLEILEVTSSCSCTAVKPERTRLAAGESTVFLVSIKTHTRTGPVNAVVTVKSNDPLNPRVQLAVEGEVRPAFKIDPTNSVTLGRITTATRLTRTIDIHNLYPEPARLSLEPIESSPWDVKLIEVKPGRDYRLEVTTRPPSPVGFVKRVVTIKTGLEQVPELAVTINSLVQPLVQVTPNRIRVPRTFKRKTEQTVRVAYDASLD